MSETSTNADWAKAFRAIWQKYRRPTESEWDDFYRRNEMRWNGWRYAEMRGWNVALTPFQRSKAQAAPSGALEAENEELRKTGRVRFANSSPGPEFFEAMEAMDNE